MYQDNTPVSDNSEKKTSIPQQLLKYEHLRHYFNILIQKITLPEVTRPLTPVSDQEFNQMVLSLMNLGLFDIATTLMQLKVKGMANEVILRLLRNHC